MLNPKPVNMTAVIVEDEIQSHEALKSLLDKNVNCYFQMIPTDSKQDIRPLVEAFKS